MKRSKLISSITIIGLLISIIGLFMFGYSISNDKQMKKIVPTGF